MENIDNSLFTFVDNNSINSEKITAPRYSYWKSVFRVFFRNPMNYVVLGLLAVILLLTLFYPLFSQYDPTNYKVNEFFNKPEFKLLSPSEALAKHGFSLKWIFGTGSNGESIFDAVWHGSKISLLLAIICSLINVTLGIVIGAVWGYSKKFDKVMQEVYNVISNIPFLLFVMVFVYVVNLHPDPNLLLDTSAPGYIWYKWLDDNAEFIKFVMALTMTGWMGIAYFIRTQVIIIRDRDYNLASKCLGTPTMRMVTRNILPFLTSVIVTMVSSEIPSYISYEVFLSYVGIGLGQSNKPSLGKLINVGQKEMYFKPWVFWAPVAVASALTVILYIVGQNLADASDPKTHM